VNGGRWMRKVAIGFLLSVIIAVAAYLGLRQPKPPLETAYAGNRQVTLWSTTAQVRVPRATLMFGDRVRVLRRFEDDVQVRTQAGTTGWVNKRELLSSELWDQARALAKRAAAMPVEARGHTSVLSNLHVEPGRQSPRVDQLNKDVPVELLARQVVAFQARGQPGGQEEVSAGEGDSGRKEDWWLVRAKTREEGTVAGWVLGRFIDLDVPEPLPDYADSAGVRIVAWFELNRVPDANGTTKGQYLVLGAKGPEGQACDFGQIRVYTWSRKHGHYETAFVDSDVCGKLPVTLTHSPGPSGDIGFSFEDWSKGPPAQRMYRMRETIVRRIGQGKRANVRRGARR
jgi:hypothetical protein